MAEESIGEKARAAASALRSGVVVAERRGQAVAMIPMRDAAVLLACAEMVADAHEAAEARAAVEAWNRREKETSHGAPDRP